MKALKELEGSDVKRRTLRLSAAILLALVCLAGTLPARAADGGELAGGAIRWQLADGTLTVSGRGAIPDFEDKSQKTMDRVPTPWYSLRGGIGRIVLEEGITAVGDHAFADLTQVRDVSLPQSLRSIGTDAFRGCAVTEVTLPEGLTQLGGFRGCGKLTSINVPETVESVGVRAFEDCGSLRALSLPDGVRSVGFYAFGGTCGIETLYLPGSVVACSGGEAFFGNPSVRAIRFPRERSGSITTRATCAVSARR
ncbi:MAG: leucine-rich repeat domain-containing protein [Ruminococcaceae bacterium]|nr:leucine-rich repeat domain-containing protein [Oscillospiraceae bacterium]